MSYIDVVMNWRERLTSDPNVCGGRVCVKGTRVMVSIILDSLADGLTAEQIVGEYPTICVEDVLATLAYAADLARERIVPLTPPSV
ncbi:MAG TPA: DUF433 domain-containing protein [Planctomycetota bacterium]|nr:DUF433 domain-containing protein [Planctomycetota bacterium]